MRAVYGTGLAAITTAVALQPFMILDESIKNIGFILGFSKRNL
jgi:hypothetical protein